MQAQFPQPVFTLKDLEAFLLENPSQAKTIVLYGGTFMPPTFAHIRAFEHVFNFFSPENSSILFLVLPAYRPPHKPGLSSSYDRRLQCLQLASPYLVSNLEKTFVTETGGESTNGTMGTATMLSRLKQHVAALKVQVPTLADPKLYFVMGGDSLQSLPAWINPEQFLEAVDGLIVIPRTEADQMLQKQWPTETTHLIQQGTQKLRIEANKVQWLTSYFDTDSLSSTKARDLLRQHQNGDSTAYAALQQILPPKVLAFVLENPLPFLNP